MMSFQCGMMIRIWVLILDPGRGEDSSIGGVLEDGGDFAEGVVTAGFEVNGEVVYPTGFAEGVVVAEGESMQPSRNRKHAWHTRENDVLGWTHFLAIDCFEETSMSLPHDRWTGARVVGAL